MTVVTVHATTYGTKYCVAEQVTADGLLMRAVPRCSVADEKNPTIAMLNPGEGGGGGGVGGRGGGRH